MTSGLKIACAYLAFAPALGVRVVRRKDDRLATDFSVVCTYEHLAVWMGEDAAEPEWDVGTCLSEEGEVYSFDPKDGHVLGAEHHDKFELTLRVLGEKNILGKAMYTVITAKLLEHAKYESLLEEGSSAAASGHSVLVVQTIWRDFSSVTKSTIEPELKIAKRMILRGSYNSFQLGKTEWTTSTIPARFKDLVNKKSETCDYEKMVNLIDGETPLSGTYKYRMLFVPGGRDVQGCGWAGIAVLGCGKPEGIVQAGCWSLFRGHAARVQAHEIGHNLGLMHAAGEIDVKEGRKIVGRKFVEYGDPNAMMGNQFREKAEFSAAARFQLGWLRERTGEVVKASNRKYSLSDISHGKNIADAVAVRFKCGNCEPLQEEYQKIKGGHLFFSFGYGKVLVHLARAKNEGTEHWADLTQGQAWMNPYGSVAVAFCSTGFDSRSNSDTANIAVAPSKSRAQSMCR